MPIATNEPVAATELGVAFIFNSDNFWLHLMASTVLDSATKTVPSAATAIAFGCDEVRHEACLHIVRDLSEHRTHDKDKNST